MLHSAKLIVPLYIYIYIYECLNSVLKLIRPMPQYIWSVLIIGLTIVTSCRITSAVSLFGFLDNILFTTVLRAAFKYEEQGMDTHSAISSRRTRSVASEGELRTQHEHGGRYLEIGVLDLNSNHCWLLTKSKRLRMQLLYLLYLVKCICAPVKIFGRQALISRHPI